MRFLAKPEQPPESIRVFLEQNLPVGINLDYRNAPLEKAKLLQELVADQGGLCAYTGVAIDERLRARQTAEGGDGLVFSAHNEHMKPQSLCRQELVDRGLEPGKHLGDDVDHRNIVAALEVRGSRESTREIFGATARPPRTLLPVLPTQPDCERRLRYLADGRVVGADKSDESSRITIAQLKLEHETLAGWRRSAYDVFAALYLAADDEQAARLRRSLDDLEGGRLLEFGFVLRSILENLEAPGASP